MEVSIIARLVIFGYGSMGLDPLSKAAGERTFASYALHKQDLAVSLQAMTDTIRLPDELGQQLREQRKAQGMSKSALAARAGKVREVVYRLEAGEDVTVSSLMAVLGALRLAMRIERVGLPTAEEVARRFQDDES